MRKKIVGIFDTRECAHMAADQVKELGFNGKDISIIGIDQEHVAPTFSDDMEPAGLAGPPSGGNAGLFIGLGTMSIPGVGMVGAVGPITTLLDNSSESGLTGGLVELGFPQVVSRDYQDRIKQGKTFWSMEVDDEHAPIVNKVLKDCGAKVEIHKRNI